MKVLVIDDSPLHQLSAQKTLADHELTIAKSYDEAYAYIIGNYEVRPTIPPQHFDAVLSDLLMPASKMIMGVEGRKFVGQLMPVGFALALMAVLKGAKYVAVVTAVNHHDHPGTAMLDGLASSCGRGQPPHEWEEPLFEINGAKVAFHQVTSGEDRRVYLEGVPCPDCSKGTGTEDPNKNCLSRCRTCRDRGVALGKDWGRILAHLMHPSQ